MGLSRPTRVGPMDARASFALTMALSGSIACGRPPTPTDGAADADASWSCPSGWVPYVLGGCAPAVIACRADGGAAPNACADAGAGSPFVLRSDGAIGGRWPEAPGATGGPPRADWLPTVGVDDCGEWARAAGGGCDPQLAERCPAGASPLPRGACTRTGIETCGAAEFPDVTGEAGSTRVHFVRAGADPAMADGTVARPYPTLADAVRAAATGEWIVLAAGTYPERLEPTRSLHVVGACALRVAIAGEPGSVEPTVRIATAGIDLDLRGVTVRSAAIGVAVAGGGSIHLTRSVVGPTSRSGVSSLDLGSTLEVSDSWIRDIGDDGTGRSRGAVAALGARIVLRDVVVSSYGDMGVAVFDPTTTAQLERVVIRDTSVSGASMFGRGVNVIDARSVRLSRVAILRARQAGVFVHGVGAAVEIADSYITATGQAAIDRGACGLCAQSGATLRATRVSLVGNEASAIAAFESGTIVRVERSVASGTVSRFDTLAPGVVAQLGARVELIQCTLDRNRGVGIAAADEQTIVRLEHSAVRDTTPGTGSTSLARGLGADGAASIEVVGSVVTGNAEMGVLAYGAGSRVSLEDSVVARSRRTAGNGAGRGLEAGGGANVVATRTLLVDNEGGGAGADGSGSILDLHDSIIMGGAATESDEDRCTFAQHGAALTMSGVAVSDCAEMGMGATGDGTVVTMVDCVVRATRQRGGFWGRGIEVSTGARLDATGVLVTDVHEIGLAASLRATASLIDVIIEQVAASPLGFGVGAVAFGDARIDAARLGAISVAGLGVGPARFEIPDSPPIDGATFTARDVFVRDVRTSTIRFERPGGASIPVGRSVAYGAHAGAGCTFSLDQFVLDGGGHGFFAAGAIALRHGVVARQLDAFGAAAGGSRATATTLSTVAQTGNANESVVDLTELPEASALPSPTAVCAMSRCP